MVSHSYSTCIFEAFKKKYLEYTISGGAPISSFVGGDHDDGSYYDDDGDDGGGDGDGGAGVEMVHFDSGGEGKGDGDDHGKS